MYKTITLGGTEQEVKIAGQNCDVRNDGADVIYASAKPNINAGDDGVLSIPAGQAAKLLDCRGTVYLLGTGTVLLCGNDYSELVFKCAAAAGGGGEDTVARNAITALTADVTDNEADIALLKGSVSNDNLLINPDFAINQPGVGTAEVSSSSYTQICDKWKAKTTTGTGAISVSPNGVSLCPNGAIVQVIENAAKLNGKAMTLSATIDGETVSGVFTWDSTKSYAAVTNGDVRLAYSGTTGYVQIYNTSASAVGIKNVKLETGRVATMFVPPAPAAEIVKCQRYYQLHTAGDIDPVDLRPSMAEITDIVEREDGKYAYIAEL